MRHIPSADQQLLFLRQIQQLLTDATFTSTYKYALLLAIAELAVELGNDSGDVLAIPITTLAEKTIALYWQQTLPYLNSATRLAPGQMLNTAQTDGSNTEPHDPISTVFLQNTAKQAAIINVLLSLRQAGCQTLAQARLSTQWPQAVKQVSELLKKMPIKYLQNLNGQTLTFLYDPQLHNGHLLLRHGVMYGLRQFQSIIQQLVKQRWTLFIQKLSANQALIGSQHDLEGFLFGSSRAALVHVEQILKPMQNQRCFFCQGQLTERGSAVDHFIPWSRYPRDTALNFVLAHRTCNGHKSDLLAAERHLTHWLTRNQQHGAELYGQLQQIGFSGSPMASHRVAQWAYQQAVQQQSYLWLEGKLMEPVGVRVLGWF